MKFIDETENDLILTKCAVLLSEKMLSSYEEYQVGSGKILESLKAPGEEISVSDIVNLPPIFKQDNLLKVFLTLSLAEMKEIHALNLSHENTWEILSSVLKKENMGDFWRTALLGKVEGNQKDLKKINYFVTTKNKLTNKWSSTDAGSIEEDSVEEEISDVVQELMMWHSQNSLTQDNFILLSRQKIKNMMSDIKDILSSHPGSGVFSIPNLDETPHADTVAPSGSLLSKDYLLEKRTAGAADPNDVLLENKHHGSM